jgi:hypothetical protein
MATKTVTKPETRVTQPGEPRRSRASVCRQLIVDGMTNEGALEAMKREFPEDDWVKHAHYPSWYRSELVRKGTITKEFARDNAGGRIERDSETEVKASKAPAAKPAAAKPAAKPLAKVTPLPVKPAVRTVANSPNRAKF